VSSEPESGAHWLVCWNESQDLVTAWESQVGRVLPTREAAELTTAIARALWAAYQRGLTEGNA
jgi:hypothetical protein